jgi:nicotinamidase-related amidase
MTKALVIIDLQNDRFPGGKIAARQVHGAFMQALSDAGARVADLQQFLAEG